jgi:hypothetical protein
MRQAFKPASQSKHSLKILHKVLGTKIIKVGTPDPIPEDIQTHERLANLAIGKRRLARDALKLSISRPYVGIYANGTT